MEQTHLPTSYDPLLAAASFLIAIFASYAALIIINRLRQSRTSNNWLWLGAATYGLGVWAMHFTAITALKMENMDTIVAYDPIQTLISVALAILGAAASFRMVTRAHLGLTQILGAGFFLGAGIGAMHYTGMLAMRLDAKMEFSPVLVGVSVLVDVALGTLGMWTLTNPNFQRLPLGHLVTATVTGLTILFMQYTAMLAVRFTPTHGEEIHGMVASGSLLSLNLFLLLAVVVVGLPIFLNSLLEGPGDPAQEVNQ